LGVSPAEIGFVFPFLADNDGRPDATPLDSDVPDASAVMARDPRRAVVFSVADFFIVLLIA
jgi:hypothetical protein